MGIGLGIRQAFLQVQGTEEKYKVKQYRRCPQCGCPELVTQAVDTFCTSCDWDTLFSYVQSGRMDKTFAALKDHDLHKLQPSPKIEKKKAA